MVLLVVVGPVVPVVPVCVLLPLVGVVLSVVAVVLAAEVCVVERQFGRLGGDLRHRLERRRGLDDGDRHICCGRRGRDYWGRRGNDGGLGLAWLMVDRRVGVGAGRRRVGCRRRRLWLGSDHHRCGLACDLNSRSGGEGGLMTVMAMRARGVICLDCSGGHDDSGGQPSDCLGGDRRGAHAHQASRGPAGAGASRTCCCASRGAPTRSYVAGARGGPQLGEDQLLEHQQRPNGKDRRQRVVVLPQVLAEEAAAITFAHVAAGGSADLSQALGDFAELVVARPHS